MILAAAPEPPSLIRKFPRSARLLDGPSYTAVFSGGKRLSDQYWTVLLHQSGLDGARLGLAIAKKRARRAVDRNRIKRVARESFRHRQDELAGYDVVVMNREAATRARSKELHEALERLWDRTQAIRV